MTDLATPSYRLQPALTRFYERRGVAGLIVASIAGTATMITVVVVVVLTSVARYLGITWQQNVRFMLVLEGLLLAALLIGLLSSRHMLLQLLSWSGEGRSEARAAELWRAFITAPRILTSRVCLVSWPVASIADVYWLRTELDQPLWVSIPVVTCVGMMTAAIGVFAMHGLQFLLRPAMLDIAARLPSNFEPLVPALPLKIKAIIPIPGAILFAVVLTGGFVDTTASFATRMTFASVMGIGGAMVAVVLFLLVTQASLAPIDELTDATRRVRAGDLTVRVPVLSADELGTLAQSFNQMLDGLRERESLCDHNVKLAAALQASLEDVRTSRARIVATADEERRRMERDLHDGAQQRLVLIKLKLAMAEQLVDTDPKAAAQLLGELRADAERAVDELRDLAHGIYPPLLESDGLVGALEDVADQSSLAVTVETDGIGRYPSNVEAAVYFCCLEALQNAAKHAGDGSHVRIQLSEDDGHLRFTVADNGRGFDLTRTNGSTGLQNMTDRIGALGGTVHINSTPDHGTRVEGTVPLSPPHRRRLDEPTASWTGCTNVTASPDSSRS